MTLSRRAAAVVLTLSLAACGGAGPNPNAVRADAHPARGASADGKVALAVQLGHTAEVYDAVFSPDGTLVATGDTAGTVLVWNPTTGVVHAALDGHNGNVTSMAFSRDGRLLATGGEDGRFDVWDLSKSKRVTSVDLHGRKVWGVAFDAEGRRCIVRTNTEVSVYDAMLGTELTQVSTESGPITVSPDGTLVVAQERGGPKVFDLVAGTELPRPERDGYSARQSVFSADGRLFLVAYGEGHHVGVYSTATGEKKQTIATSAEAVGVAIDDSGRLAAVALAGSGIYVVDPLSGTGVSRVDARSTSQWLFGMASDGKSLFAALGKGEIGLFDPRSGKLLSKYDSETPIRRIVVDRPRGRIAILHEGSPKVEVWDGERVVGHLDPATEDVKWAGLSADGRSLAVVHEKSSDVVVHDLATGGVKTVLPTGLSRLYSAIPSPDGRWLFATGYSESALVDIGTKKVAQRFEGAQWSAQFEGTWGRGGELVYVGVDSHSLFRLDANQRPLSPIAMAPASPSSLAFRPDGGRVASAAPTSMAFSPDGTRLALAGRPSLALLRGEAFEKDPGVPLDGAAYGLAWSPDGSRIAIASEQGLVLYEVAAGTARTLDTESFVSVAFSRDGQYLAAGARKNRVDLYRTETGLRERTLDTRKTPWSIDFLRDTKRPVMVVAAGRLFLVRVDDGAIVRLRSFDMNGRKVGLATSATGIAGDPEALRLVLAHTSSDARSTPLALPSGFAHPSLALDLGR